MNKKLESKMEELLKQVEARENSIERTNILQFLEN